MHLSKWFILKAPDECYCASQVMRSSSSCRFVTGTEEQDGAGEGPGSPPVTPEPMLCAEAGEGEVPHSLEVLHHAAQSRGPCDSLVVASHLLMLETGFVPQVGGESGTLKH